jgi:hypothetical protein
MIAVNKMKQMNFTQMRIISICPHQNLLLLLVN